MAINCKGRNGYFKYHSHYAGMLGDGEGFIQLFSNSPHTRSSPLQFYGPPREVINLLRQIARELESANRANVAHNFHQERIKKHD